MVVLKGGVTGRVAFIDLSVGKASVDTIDEDLLSLFYGGKGLAYALVARHSSWSTLDPLYDPANAVVVANGVLSALAPGSSKVVFASRSPLTGMICDSYAGQVFGAKLKRAGFDALVLLGRAPEPVYIYVEDGRVEVRSASHLWGAFVKDVVDAVRRETRLGASVAAIGPAGEKLVRYANVIVDGFRAAGRCGIGAVLGFKRVKAIAVWGSLEPPVVDRDAWRRAYVEVYSELRDDISAKATAKYGTNNGVVTCSRSSMCPGSHWRRPWLGGREEQLSGDRVLEREVPRSVYASYAGVIWGWGCPVKCSKLVTPRLKGKEYIVVKPEYENLAMLGVVFDIYDLDSILWLEHLANQYGIDSISFGETVSWLGEMLEEGLVSREEVGVDKILGEPKAVERLLRDVATRRGVGSILAEGVERAARLLGRGIEKAVHVKGLESAAWDPRGYRGLALSYATADVGASHLRGWPRPRTRPSKGIDEDVVKSLIEDRDWKALLDTLGLCAFVPYTPERINRILEPVAGVTVDELLLVGWRVEAVARIYGALVGRVPEGDAVPRRWMEPIREGPLKGEKAFRSEDEFREALRMFYRLRGYDEERGLPTRSTLEKLGLTRLGWLVKSWEIAWDEVSRRLGLEAKGGGS